MLSQQQKRVIFYIFCIVILIFAGVEVAIVWNFLSQGFNTGNGVAVFVNSSFLAACGELFRRMVKSNFSQGDKIQLVRLHKHFADRSKVLADLSTADPDEFAIRTAAISNTLKFAEQTLRGWLPGTHLEFCVFVDPEWPLMIAYFNSSLNEVNMSMEARKNSRSYYKDNSYEAAKLLADPGCEFRVIADTHDTSASYAFVRREQKSQILSTVLICMDVANPCVLVVTSNAKNAFEQDEEVSTFLRAISEYVRSDLNDAGFANRIKNLKPELFDA
jgi:hypothetical protein